VATNISTEAQEDLRQLLQAWVERHAKAAHLAEVEEVCQEVKVIAGQCVMETLLHRLTGTATYRGTKLPCPCGKEARFVAYRKRWVKSVCGECQVKRSYYHCRSCGAGCSPWDKEQGLTDRMWSASLKALICQVMGRLTYAEGVSLLSELRVAHLEESSAEEIVSEVGGRLRAEEARKVEALERAAHQELSLRLLCGSEDPAPVEHFATREVTGKRLYVGLDAATAHIGGGWHNVQVGVVFAVRADAKGRDTLTERSYLAAQMDQETFGKKLRARAEEWNIRRYSEAVVLGDGAPSNWNLASLHFPDATHILDFYHAGEHVWSLSRALYRQDDPRDKARGDRWVQERLDSLKTQGPTPLLRALKRRKPSTTGQREALRRETGYFQNNRHRMNYPDYLKAGMMIGSGPVEAACKVVVGQRMKQAGMRWSVSGADSMLAVRTTVLNRDTTLLQQMSKAA
jgi:hypothetical protein